MSERTHSVEPRPVWMVLSAIEHILKFDPRPEVRREAWRQLVAITDEPEIERSAA